MTIGLRGCKASNESGITWTMPLAQMRYYGDPIRSTRSIGTSHCGFHSMILSTSPWEVRLAIGVAPPLDLESVCKFWIKLAARCDSEVLELDYTPLAWLRLFSVKASFVSYRKRSREKRSH